MTDSQLSVPCDVDGCDNSAQYECLNCEDAFCTGCKTKHENKKENHKFVLYSERLKLICKTHSENKYIYWCKKCSEPCCAKCSITLHKGHVMDDIEDAIREKNISVTKTLKGPFEECLKQWKSIVDEAKEMTSEYKDNIEKIDQDLISHAAQIHQAIDKTLAKVRSELRQTSKNKEMELQAQETALNEKYEELKRNIEELERLLRRNDVSLLEYNLDTDNMKAPPALSRHPLPSYTLGQIDDDEIITMIGTMANLNNNSGFTELCRPTLKVVGSFKIDNSSVMHIACTYSSGLAFVTNRQCFHNMIWKITNFHTPDYTCILKLVNRDGVILDSNNTNFGFNDMALTLDGDILLTDATHYRIMSALKGATSWRITPLFSTQYRPFGICWLRNGDLIVTYCGDRRVIQYSSEGDIIHEFDPKLFSCPNRVSVNKVNEDLYVCDTGRQKVLVFDKDHRLRYEYTGSGTRSFDPWDVCTDSSGRVLIVDHKNNRVHVLDKDGKFLKYLQSGLLEPNTIDIDSEGYAWIGGLNGEVIIVKF